VTLLAGKSAAAPSSVPRPSRDLGLEGNKAQGPRCKFPVPFSFVLKNSKLVNSFKNRRKIRKMQTQLFWNL
jgi:hypothetical protein